MDHVAIMKKSWGLTEKILTGEKKIESRWYFNKSRPWGSINSGDRVYFKNSGEPVVTKAEVNKVIQFDNLTPARVKEILYKYGEDDGIEKTKIPEYFERFKDKKYCILVFLRNPIKINPFEINKTGFGTMSAWLTVNSVDSIKARFS